MHSEVLVLVLSAHKPVILLTFANPSSVPEAYLPWLNKEAESVYRHLIPYEIDDKCNLDQLNNASLDQVFNTVEAWSNKKEIILFHYGGHAEGGGLMLTSHKGDMQEAKAEGLAKLLGSLPSLKLVFLNGCSTLPQLELLLDNGVKAVIATSEPIRDDMAYDFADRFYQNLSSGISIRDSFDRARIFLETKYKLSLDQPLPYRKITFKGKETKKDELPWGLYFHPDHERVLDWKLPQEKEEKEQFSIRDKYTCDRADQNSRFRSQFIKNRSASKFQFYVIHGAEEQSPNGLFNRFVLEHIAPTYERYFHKIIAQEEAANYEDAKMNAVSAFFRALELNPNHYPGELNIETLAKSKIAREVDCIVLMFRIYSSEWKPFTRKYLNWVIRKFCDSSRLPNHAPDFIVFANIVYDNESKGKFKALLGRNPAAKVRKTVNDFVDVRPLPELPPVLPKDLSKWMDRLTDDYDRKQELMEKYFPEKAELPMSKVEKKLERIIEEFN